MRILVVGYGWLLLTTFNGGVRVELTPFNGPPFGTLKHNETCNMYRGSPYRHLLLFIILDGTIVTGLSLLSLFP
jgi:hypothetical protein